MIAKYVKELESVLSHDRLSRYRKPGADDLSMVIQYLWNVELCESLYQSLGALEVAFRNSVHATLTACKGRPDWYDIPTFLLPREAAQVVDAKNTIVRGHKSVTPGRIVAAVTFGFWVSLLSNAYSSIWTSSNQALVKQAFPLAPVGMQYRGRVFKTMNDIRLLRNRVFHFESIADDADIVNKHDDIIDAIGWLNLAWQLSTQEFDRFLDVHTNGYQRIEQKLKKHLGIP